MNKESEVHISDYDFDGEVIYNPMTGQFGRYEYCEFSGEAEVLENGKFQYTTFETEWSGDREDDGQKHDCDRGEKKVYDLSPEFDTIEEMGEYAENVELKYQDETELTYAGSVDYSDSY